MWTLFVNSSAAWTRSRGGKLYGPVGRGVRICGNRREQVAIVFVMNTVRKDVNSTEMKGLRETEAFDREYVGNIRICGGPGVA